MAKSSVIIGEFKAIQTALEVLEPLDHTQRRFAITMILSRLGMTEAPTIPSLAGVSGGGATERTGTGGNTPASPGLKGMTPKDFLKQKNPTTDLERFICLAYYLTHSMDTSNFTTRDITKLNGEAHGADFSNAAATANNGVSQSKFLSRAGSGRKRITQLGESVVEALPDREKVKEVVAAAPRRSKAKGRKRKAKPTGRSRNP